MTSPAKAALTALEKEPADAPLAVGKTALTRLSRALDALSRKLVVGAWPRPDRPAVNAYIAAVLAERDVATSLIRATSIAALRSHQQAVESAIFATQTTQTTLEKRLGIIRS
jgi:hypothetical protein